MKIIIYLLCFGVIIIGLIGIGASKKQYETILTGKKVNVIVTYVPKVDFYNDVTYKFEFVYKSRKYSKTLNIRECGQLHQGDNLFLFYNEDKNIFLCENENPKMQAISSIFIIIIGIVGLLFTFKRS